MVLPVIEIDVEGNRLFVEVASTPDSRRCGLSGRGSLRTDGGMLFVQPVPTQFSLWMMDTGVPLAAAFIEDPGRIVSIEQMEPNRSDIIYRSPHQVRYALEVNQGWFARNGVSTGDTVSFSLPAGLIIE